MTAKNIQQEKIINSIWTASKEERDQANQELINNMDNVHEFYIGFRKIRNFSLVKTNDNKFMIYYGLKRGSARNYFVDLFGTSFAFNNDCLIALRDVNWQDFDNNQLNNRTKELLNKN